MKLNNIIHDADCRLWCGLAALSCISGQPTAYCKEILRKVIDAKCQATGQTRVIKGIYQNEMIAALELLGYQCKIVPISKTMKEWSLARFMHFIKPIDRLWLVTIPGHFIVTDGDVITDTDYSQISLYDYPRIEDKVVSIVSIEELDLT